MKKEKLKINKGFTLIEVLIAVGLFVIIMTMGVASVLQVNTAYKKSQQQRAMMDTLSFVMEDMVRNIALGTEINCGVSSAGPTSNDYYSANLEIYSDNASCYDILGISFLPFDNGSTRTAYAFLGPDNEHLRLYKSTQAGADFYPVTPPEIKIDATKSGFRVTGAELFPDTQQPKVTIRLAGKMVWKGVESPFDLETTVSQRLIDGE